LITVILRGMAVLKVIMRYREIVKSIQNLWRIILAIIVLVILIWMGYVWLVTGRWPDWTGFGTKTLWDFMELLIIPAILAGGAYWLNESARKREKEVEESARQQEIEIAKKRAEAEDKIASSNRQETALQTYLDKMTELLLDKKLRESEMDSEVRAVARARTLTVLRRLDGERKGALLQFLYEADLIGKNKIVINLAKADLSKAYLSGACLGGAYLSKANLSGAILSEADLSGADLSKTILSGAFMMGANLSNADLKRVNLSGANLISADLKGAYLKVAYLSYASLMGADLSGADLSTAMLSEADLSNAILSKAKYTKNDKLFGATIWPEGFDPVAAGAICVDE
jgi:uncharacterized protein YjbI with pentapeptide repeats